MIEGEIHLTPEEVEAVDALVPVRAFKKGQLLLEEGSIARECYFNIKGCVRSFQIIDGEERTTQFYVEGDAIASLLSYLEKTPANHYLECIEDCTLAVLGYDNERELYRQHPKFESLCRVSMEREFGRQQEILQHYLTRNPEERYLMLQETRPELIQRVPQYHLATFLGIQPESLSRIKRRVARRNKP